MVNQKEVTQVYNPAELDELITRSVDIIINLYFCGVGAQQS